MPRNSSRKAASESDILFFAGRSKAGNGGSGAERRCQVFLRRLMTCALHGPGDEKTMGEVRASRAEKTKSEKSFAPPRVLVCPPTRKVSRFALATRALGGEQEEWKKCRLLNTFCRSNQRSISDYGTSDPTRRRIG